MVVTFLVVAGGFTVDLAICLCLVFACFISSVASTLLPVGPLVAVGCGSFFREGGRSAHCTKQFKTTRVMANWIPVHHIELQKKT